MAVSTLNRYLYLLITSDTAGILQYGITNDDLLFHKVEVAQLNYMLRIMTIHNCTFIVSITDLDFSFSAVCSYCITYL